MNKLKELIELDKDELVNRVYNGYVLDWADVKEDDSDFHDVLNEKRIPYIGWFWRQTDFVNKDITLGNANGYIGVMENNKWDYPQRQMTKEEATKFIEFIDRAVERENNGGLASEIYKDIYAIFKELRNWMQTLEVSQNGGSKA